MKGNFCLAALRMVRYNLVKKDLRGKLEPYLFLAPSLLGVATFLLVPFAETVRRSFFDTRGNRFVGFANYQSVLQNEAFRLAARNTLRFTSVCVPLLLCLSLALALALRMKSLKQTHLAEYYRTTFLLPMAIPVASIALLWKILFARTGLINALFNTDYDFMGTDAAFWVLIATYLWKNVGASTWRQFTAITLPNLCPTLLVTGILSLLNTYKVFREAYLVAGAYPQDSIYLLQHLFNNWFLALDLPRLCAAAVLVALMLLLLIALFLKRR